MAGHNYRLTMPAASITFIPLLRKYLPGQRVQTIWHPSRWSTLGTGLLMKSACAVHGSICQSPCTGVLSFSQTGQRNKLSNWAMPSNRVGLAHAEVSNFWIQCWPLSLVMPQSCSEPALRTWLHAAPQKISSMHQSGSLHSSWEVRSHLMGPELFYILLVCFVLFFNYSL